jgi:shikimate kinase
MVKFIQKKYTVDQPEMRQVYEHKSGIRRDRFDLSASNIYFVGPRGSGKSSLAKELATELEVPCVDLDDVIEHHLGISISSYVLENGWPAFRHLESHIFYETCQKRGQVVAPGGGIVLSEAHRNSMKSSGVIFYLMASVDLLVARLHDDPKKEQRPELTPLQLQEEVSLTLREREPLYFQCLDYILQAAKPVGELVSDIKALLELGRS